MTFTLKNFFYQFPQWFHHMAWDVNLVISIGRINFKSDRDRILETMILDLACEKYLLSLFNSSF